MMKSTSQIRAASYGGGVQSTALLVLAAQKRIDYPLFLMANVGDDSEHPATIAYVRDVAVPYAAKNGVDLRILNKTKRDGSTETLYRRLMRDAEGSGTSTIPAHLPNGMPVSRNCTVDYKIKVIGKWLKAAGATADNPALVAMGISLDEIERANTNNTEDYRQVSYPLISIGDDTGLHMRRDDCSRIIAEAGLPVPPKSSCYFCPFHRPSVWQDMRREEPELFEKSADLEDRINSRRTTLGKKPVFLTRFAIPLREAIQGDAQGVLFTELGDEDSSCDSGVCFT